MESLMRNVPRLRLAARRSKGLDMDPSELTDELEGRPCECKAEGELAELAESDDMALTLDELDSVAGGRGRRKYEPRRHIGPDARREEEGE